MTFHKLIDISPSKIKRPGFFDTYEFEIWHLIIIVPVWIIGLYINSYLYKNKYKKY